MQRWFIDSPIDTQVLLCSSARVLFRDQMMCGQRRIRAVTFNGELMRWITGDEYPARPHSARTRARSSRVSRQKYLSSTSSGDVCASARLVLRADEN